MNRLGLVLAALWFVVVGSFGARAQADNLVAPRTGDACAAAVPALFKSETNLPLSKVLLNKTWSSQDAWTYDVSVPGGYIEYIFTACATKPQWLNTNFVWRNRKIPIRLTLSSGDVRSIAASLNGSKPLIRAQDKRGRSVSTVFAPQEEIFIGIHRDKGGQGKGLEAGFGVTHSDYCASIIETSQGPKVQWCGG